MPRRNQHPISTEPKSTGHERLNKPDLPGSRSLAGVEGVEPPTPGFGDRCSSQLSYTPKASAAVSCPLSCKVSSLCLRKLNGRRLCAAWRHGLERVKGIEPSS